MKMKMKTKAILLGVLILAMLSGIGYVVEEFIWVLGRMS